MRKFRAKHHTTRAEDRERRELIKRFKGKAHEGESQNFSVRICKRTSVGGAFRSQLLAVSRQGNNTSTDTETGVHSHD